MFAPCGFKSVFVDVLQWVCVLQVVSNRETQETLLCMACVFEVSNSEHGAQHHIYRLIKEWDTASTFLSLCLSHTLTLTHHTRTAALLVRESPSASCPVSTGARRVALFTTSCCPEQLRKNLTLSDKLITLKRLCLCAYKPSASLAHSWTMPLTTTFCLKCCVFSRSAQVQGVTVKRRYVLLLFHLIPISFFFF